MVVTSCVPVELVWVAETALDCSWGTSRGTQSLDEDIDRGHKKKSLRL